MDFALNDDHRLLRELARRVAREVVAPRAAEIDRVAEYPTDFFEAFRDTGLLGTGLPADVGGAGLGTLGLIIAVEELAKFCNSAALMLLLTRLPTAAITLHGSDAQRQRYTRGVAEGTLRGAFAITEPGAGSDAAAITTSARRDGYHYVLDGSKTFISGATVADYFVVSTKTDPAGGARGISVFVVARDTPGLSVSPPIEKMGVRGVPIAQVFFQDCRIPAANLIGRENDGFKVIMETVNSVRPVVAARGLGLAEGAVDYATRYARERQTFGRPIVDHQVIQFKLAELAMRIEAARLLVYQAGWLVDQGDLGPTVAPYLSMAKAYASELAVKAADEAVQILGGNGYMAEYPMERFYRDAKQLMIVEGTSEIQRLIIGRAVANGTIAYL